MTKILMTMVMLFSISSFASGKGGKVLWPNFKNDCVNSGGIADPVPKNCADYAAMASTHPQLTYIALPDGASANEKCCIKCKTTIINSGSIEKCNNSAGAVWFPLVTTQPAKDCCLATNPGSSSSAVVSYGVATRSCMPGRVVVSPAPSPNDAVTCNAITGYHWDISACCKVP